MDCTLFSDNPIVKPGCWAHWRNPRLRATSHTRLRAHDPFNSSTLIGGKAEPVQVYFTLRLRDQWSMWMQDGCEVYMDSYTASNGLWLMVTWTIFKNHLLELGLTQNWETMALQMLATVDFLFYHSLNQRELLHTSHNIIQLMSCVHGSSSRFKNNDSGCWNPIASYWI